MVTHSVGIRVMGGDTVKAITIDKEKVEVFIKRRASSWIWKIFRFLLIIGICYIFLFPVLYMITIAVRPPSAVDDPSSVWIPRQVSLESIQMAVKLLDYGRSATQTLIISLGSTLASLLSCALVGYGFARFKFRGKNLAFALLVLTIIVPPTTLVMPSYLNFRDFDLLALIHLPHDLFFPNAPLLIPRVSVKLTDTALTFILPSLFATGLRSGLFVFIFRQFFVGMPKDLEEAARIDGCGYLKTFVRIMLPLAVPAIVTVALFSFIWHWNDSQLSAMYYDTNMPLSVMLSQIKAAMQNENIYNISNNTPDQIRTYLQAGCLLTILPPLILYIFTQRFFTESVERTGIVG